MIRGIVLICDDHAEVCSAKIDGGTYVMNHTTMCGSERFSLREFAAPSSEAFWSLVADELVNMRTER